MADYPADAGKAMRVDARRCGYALDWRRPSGSSCASPQAAKIALAMAGATGGPGRRRWPARLRVDEVDVDGAGIVDAGERVVVEVRLLDRPFFADLPEESAAHREDEGALGLRDHGVAVDEGAAVERDGASSTRASPRLDRHLGDHRRR
ncbi:MAG: hypothetical protein U0599_10285 [Vicinamibacteria bacterium]